jgi:ABC-type methionine transport system permease subunit
MSNRPHVLVDAFAPPPLVVPPLLVVPLLVALLLPFTELMLGVAIAPLGATIPLVIKK